MPSAADLPSAPGAPASEAPAPPLPGSTLGVFIHTFGCQMNEYDSAQMLEHLRAQRYRPVPAPEQAHLVLVNTCAIREKSEHKVFSLLGRLAELKQRRPGLVLGVTGCVAQQRGAEILRRAPQVDLVLGTDNLFELGQALEQVRRGERVVRTQWHARTQPVQNFIPDAPPAPEPAASEWTAPDLDAAGSPAPAGPPSAAWEAPELAEPPAAPDWAPRQAPVLAQLAVTKGCNNFCTFCIVPYTRGLEVSREPDNILAEARAQVARGVREITLLGQNVNSYQALGVDFVELLRRLHALPGLARLRYTSPHPKDFHERLAQAHVDLPKLCEQVHLPVQSGSDRLLQAMRRNHSRAVYLEKVRMLRACLPQVALSTDLIVGFPGETEPDFQATLDLMTAVRFEQVYAFKFSPRARTPAARYGDQVPEAVKTRRLQRVFALHEAILQERHQALVGTRQEVLVEGRARQSGASVGRTRGGKITTVLDCPAPPGSLVPVDIVAARRFSLVAREAP